MFARTFATTRAVLQAKVFPSIRNADELANFLRSPRGNVHDLVPGPTSVVDSKVVRKMLQLSGLESDISPELEQKWIDALNTQIGFINQLQVDDFSENDLAETNAEAFRLLASDHQPSEPLDLKELMKQVEENHNETCDDSFTDFGNTVNSSVKL